MFCPQMDAYERSLISENEQNKEDHVDVRKGQWGEEEDLMLKAYVDIHGEGRWNSVSSLTGLKRSGKSCRLRWMNYLKPGVRRGNISLQEQLLILQLHSRWGNRWSKISREIPGRTDNEIKNYWRTRVQKHAKQLKCDVNSKQFKDTMRCVWIPRLIERIYASFESFSDQSMDNISSTSQIPHANTIGSVQVDTSVLHELSNTSSDDTYAQVSSVPEFTDCYNELNVSNDPNSLQNGSGLCSENLLSTWNVDDGGESMESVWNEENITFLRQHLFDDDI